MSPYNLISLLGLAAFVFTAWIMSKDRKNFNWRVVLWGTGLQLGFAAFIFLVPAGTTVFMFLNDAVVYILGAAAEGTKFLFGSLALPPGTEGSPGFILATQGLPMVVFFAALIGLLYYVGVMQILIDFFARIFTKWMELSGAESLCVSSNIFVGVESALTVRPYLAKMTRSELCTILTAMMATIASSMLALYAMMLQPVFSSIAGHLISASILSAPAALVMSKVIYPEDGVPVTMGQVVKGEYQREANPIEAVMNGALSGGKMLFGICVMLLAFLGLAGLANKLIVPIGGVINGWLGWNVNFSLQGLLGYVFYPFTVMMGVPVQDAVEAARIIGQRAIVTELTAYQDLAVSIAAGHIVDPRSMVLTSYALCGFAHIASLGIFIGGCAALAPERIKDLSAVGIRALLAATLACLMTGAAAGVFLTEGSILLR